MKFHKFIGLLLTWSTIASAQVDPRTHWEEIETPHFRILFDSKHYELAKKYALYAELSFTADTREFSQSPSRTTILILDNTDAANGYATGLPYPMIGAFPVLPSPLDSIDHYGNWGLELLIHEYTHVLTFEPAEGVWKPLRWVFGTLARPNMLLPRWYLEGIAVEMETRYSRHGRLRSPSYLSIVRALTEENQLYSIDISRVNDISKPDWPGGIRPYLFGALLWNEMIRSLGDSRIINDLNQAYARGMPFFIDGPVMKRFGRDYPMLLTQTYDRLSERAQTQLQKIQSAPAPQGKSLPQTGFYSHTPQISPDGTKLLFVSKTHDEENRIEILERSSLKTSFVQAERRRLLSGTNIERASWLPDSNGFIYNTIDTHDRYYEYSDLHFFDLHKKKNKQITHGLRAKDPAVAPNGQTIVFVQNTTGGTQLASVDMEGNNYRVLYTPERLQTRISRPEFLNNEELVFVEKAEGGREGLKKILWQKPNSAPEAILTDYEPAQFPRNTTGGLLFVSNRSGTANVYIASKDWQKVRALTNTTTLALTPEFDPHTQELLYSRLRAEGPWLYALSANEWKQVPPTPPTIPSLTGYEWPDYKHPRLKLSIERESYQPWGYLVPRYWYPFVSYIRDGVYTAASTSAADPLQRHAYSLTGAYDTVTERASFAGLYSNNTRWFPLSLLQGQDTHDYLYSSKIIRRNTMARAAYQNFIPYFNEDWKWGIGWQYWQTSIESDHYVRSGPQLSLQFSNIEQKGLQISPEQGAAFKVSETVYVTKFGNMNYEQTDFQGQAYFSNWLPEHHVLAFLGNAAVAPRLKNSLIGASTTEAGYQNTLADGPFLLRGYPSGALIGPTVVNTSVEYRFPLAYPYRGFGTRPIFVQKWHGALFADAATGDGYIFDYSTRRYSSTELWRRYLVGVGAEARVDLTLAYHLPIRLIVGLHYGIDQKASDRAVSPYIGFGM